MTEKIVEPVRITDNGVRSFIPPTFCFELRDLGDTLVETVSRVIHGERRDFDVVADLRLRHMAALGRITDYDAGPQARVPGKQFTIDQVIHVPE
ncbi:hypothetical protein [Nocardia mexicana]|uniref:Uncharacterized protein n=1 Tax=Nocardia mexicana TaxID=279262 RepID=A0A370H281_9NOCA|nr:hypothetical protein [Nocardia mexicana]RDI50119.1 hypothetical protein DFR68_106558 [Nocardia mexicana]